MKKQGMGRRRAAWSVGAIAVLVLGAGGYRFWSQHQRVDLRLSCVPGETHAYALDYASQGELHQGQFALGRDRSVKVTARGRVTETCLVNSPEGMRVAVSFEAVSGSLASSESARSEDVASLLVGESFVDVATDGRVRGMAFAPEMPDYGQHILRDILSLRSLTLRSAGPANEAWSTEEEDVQGKYRSRYAIANVGRQEVAVDKTREEYVRRGGSPQPTVAGNNGTAVRVDRLRHAVASVNAHARFEIHDGGKLMAATEGRLSLQTVSFGQRSDVASLLARAEARPQDERHDDLAGRAADARADEQAQRNELGNDTWASLLARADGGDAKAKTYLKLRALFRLQPGACALAARELVRRAKTGDETFMVLLSGLSDAGTPESQRALVEAARGLQGAPEAQLATLASLGSAKAPTVETEAALRAFVNAAPDEDAGRTARLALGIVARSVREDAPERARTIEQEALGALRGARGPEEQAMGLGVLGNIGGKAGLEPAREGLGSPVPAVRESAAAALRFVDDPSAETLLVSAATDDADANVRLQAVGALGFRPLSPATVAALRDRMFAERIDNVRGAVVALLGNEVARYPELVGPLERVVSDDAVAAVRDAARLALLRVQRAGL